MQRFSFNLMMSKEFDRELLHNKKMWRTSDGRKLFIADMPIQHVESILQQAQSGVTSVMARRMRDEGERLVKMAAQDMVHVMSMHQYQALQIDLKSSNVITRVKAATQIAENLAAKYPVSLGWDRRYQMLEAQRDKLLNEYINEMADRNVKVDIAASDDIVDVAAFAMIQCGQTVTAPPTKSEEIGQLKLDLKIDASGAVKELDKVEKSLERIHKLQKKTLRKMKDMKNATS